MWFRRSTTRTRCPVAREPLDENAAGIAGADDVLIRCCGRCQTKSQRRWERQTTS
jgi:hypothetical protein